MFSTVLKVTLFLLMYKPSPVARWRDGEVARLLNENLEREGREKVTRRLEIPPLERVGERDDKLFLN